jgi:hypothetical protein
MGKEPFQAGGRIGEWAAGAFGAVAAVPAVLRARATGRGEHIDLSMLETANMVFTNFSESMNRLMNGSPRIPEHAFLAQSVETPSIEPTADGYVGFCTNSRQQFSDFLLMIERPDLQEDEVLAQFAGRLMRFEEWNGIMREWLGRKATQEIIELASLLRIPVAPICNGETAGSCVPDGPIESMTSTRRIRAPLRGWGRTRRTSGFLLERETLPRHSWGKARPGRIRRGRRIRPMGSRWRVCASST